MGRKDFAPYKDLVQKLFLKEGNTLQEVIDHIREHHGFDASKAQYERQISKWEFHKNKTASEWAAISHSIKKRKQEGQDSRVCIDGVLISPKRIRKEISRHDPPKLLCQNEHPSPQTGDHIYIHTPPSSSNMSFLLQKLPCFDFWGFSRFEDTPPSPISSVVGTNTGSQYPDLAVTASRIVSYIGNSVSSLSGKTSYDKGITGEPLALAMLSDYYASSLRGGNSKLQQVKEIRSNLQAILPENVELPSSNTDVKFQAIARKGLNPYLGLIIYLVSNNLLPKYGSSRLCDTLVRNLEHDSSWRALKTVLLTKRYAYEAFRENLFRIAAKRSSFKLLKMLIIDGMSPDTKVNYEGHSAIHYVIKNKNIDLLSFLISSGARLDTRPSSGGPTVLEQAVSSRNIEAIHLLLAAGTLSDDTQRSSLSPKNCQALHHAAYEGQVDIIELLLEAGAQVDSFAGATSSSGSTPLMIAAKQNHLSACRKILAYGADVNIPKKDGTTALILAILHADPEIIQELLHAGANADIAASDQTPLSIAVVYCEIDVVQMLLRAGANPFPGKFLGRTPLAHSIYHKEEGMTQLLLAAGAFINDTPARKYEALLVAVETKRMDLVQLFLNLNIDINPPPDYSDTKTALMAAVSRGYTELVQNLLAAGADFNILPVSFYSAGRKCEECTEFIESVALVIRAGADINAVSARGETILHLNAARGDLQMVRFLLDAGANVNALSSSDSCGSALQSAASQGHTEIVQLLLSAGAEVNSPAGHEYKKTALQAAAARGCIATVQLLLGAGAQIDAPPGRTSGTALQEAVRSGNVELVQMLLEHGAEVNSKAYYPWKPTALQLAVRIGDIELASILIAAGADVNALPANMAYKGYDFDPGEKNSIKWLVNGPSLCMTALQLSVYQSSLGMSRLLLEAGADINAPRDDFAGRTALETAVHINELDLILLLLEHNADVNAAPLGRSAKKWHGDSPQRTCLQYASERGNYAMVKRFLYLGADVNAPAAEYRGITALQGAAAGGYVGIALHLIEAGADVNASKSQTHGRTALEVAAEHGHIDMVQLLLNAGAYVSPGTFAHQKLLWLAKEEGHMAVWSLIKSHFEDSDNVMDPELQSEDDEDSMVDSDGFYTESTCSDWEFPSGYDFD